MISSFVLLRVLGVRPCLIWTLRRAKYQARQLGAPDMEALGMRVKTARARFVIRLNQNEAPSRWLP